LRLAAITLLAGCTTIETPTPPVEPGGWMISTFQQLAPDLLKFACLSDAAYAALNPASVCGQMFPETALWRFHPQVVAQNDTADYVLAFDDAKHEQYIAIRGTNPKKRADLLIDADLRKPATTDYLGVRMHIGFHDYAEAVIKDLRGNSHLKPGYKTILAGHSLGGAAALIVALELHFSPNRLLDVDSVFTYGQPRAFDNAGATSWPIFAQHIYRVVSCADPVPLVPRGDGLLDNILDLRIGGTTAQDYQQFGQEILLFDGGAYWWSDGIEVWSNYHHELNTMLFAILKNEPIDHAIANYAGRIEKAMAPAASGPLNPAVNPPCTPDAGLAAAR